MYYVTLFWWQHYLGCTIVLRTDCYVMRYFTIHKGLLTLAFWRTMMFTSIKHNFLLENIFFLSLTFSAFLQSLPLCVAAFFAINMHCFSEFGFVWNLSFWLTWLSFVTSFGLGFLPIHFCGTSMDSGKPQPCQLSSTLTKSACMPLNYEV